MLQAGRAILKPRALSRTLRAANHALLGDSRGVVAPFETTLKPKYERTDEGLALNCRLIRSTRSCKVAALLFHGVRTPTTAVPTTRPCALSDALASGSIAEE